MTHHYLKVQIQNVGRCQCIACSSMRPLRDSLVITNVQIVVIRWMCCLLNGGDIQCNERSLRRYFQFLTELKIMSLKRCYE